MSIELIPGKWYKNFGINKDYIAKFDSFDKQGNFITNSTYIYKNRLTYSSCNGRLTTFYTDIKECSLEEIQEYLPEDHPDKFKKEWWKELKEGDYVVSLKNCYEYRTKDYIYKIYENYSDGFICYLGNTLQKRSSSIPDEFRKATPEEARLYEKYNKPVSIYINDNPKSKLIKEAIEKGFIKGNKFIDLVHGIKFEIIKEVFDNYNNDNQLYIKCYSKKSPNKFARIYLNGQWAKVVSEKTDLNTKETDLVIVDHIDLIKTNINKINESISKQNDLVQDWTKKQQEAILFGNIIHEEFFGKINLNQNKEYPILLVKPEDLEWEVIVSLSKLKFIKEYDCKEIIPEKIIIKTNIKFI